MHGQGGLKFPESSSILRAPFAGHSWERLRLSRVFLPRTVDLATFGEPHAVRLRVLQHRQKPVASRHTARPKRLTQDRVRYHNDEDQLDETSPSKLEVTGTLHGCTAAL